MRLRPVIARFAIVASALAIFAGSLVFARMAMADGREGRRPPTPPPAQQQTYVPTTPDIPSLAGAAPPQLSAAGAGVSPCISTEEAYLAISHATEGADIDAISAALAEVESDPAGVNSDLTQPSLANRLRSALGLGPSAPPCETVLAALTDSVQLAQIAAAAVPGGPTTGGIGDPPPTSPSYRPLTPISITGARGHGYCSNVSQGCPG